MAEPLTDEVVDVCYEAMIAELDNWEFVPQPLADGRWLVRSCPRASGPLLEGTEPTTEALDLFFFTEKKYAVAFMQYQGLRAALTCFRDQHLAEPSQPDAGTQDSNPNA